MWKHSYFSLTRICLRSCFFFPMENHHQPTIWSAYFTTFRMKPWLPSFDARSSFLILFRGELLSWAGLYCEGPRRRTAVTRLELGSFLMVWWWWCVKRLCLYDYIWLIWRHWSHTKQNNLRYLEEQQFLYILICWYSQAMLLDWLGDFGCIETRFWDSGDLAPCFRALYRRWSLWLCEGILAAPLYRQHFVAHVTDVTEPADARLNWIEVCEGFLSIESASHYLPPWCILLNTHIWKIICILVFFQENYVSQNKCMEILMCVFSGLAHLHSLNIVHHDVKAAPWPIHRLRLRGMQGGMSHHMPPTKMKECSLKKDHFKRKFHLPTIDFQAIC